MYDRKIIYLHRYEGEMDKGNVGYIKQENRDGICSFLVSLMNLPPSYQADTTLVVLPSAYTVCKVHIKDGKGQGMAVFEEKHLVDEGVFYKDICGYRIEVSKDICILGDVSLPKKPREEVAPLDKPTGETIKAEEIDTASIPEEVFESVEYSQRQEVYKSKWEQLKSGRKKVNLMGKESNYIQITPNDMIALSNPYHSLVNNAFLLHGYYNYKHLILGPAKGIKSTFFIGVPGNFYKQEVNAARMFGFEYFENGGDKVEVGDFGYYMKKVKL